MNLVIRLALLQLLWFVHQCIFESNEGGGTQHLYFLLTPPHEVKILNLETFFTVLTTKFRKLHSFICRTDFSIFKLVCPGRQFSNLSSSTKYTHIK